MYFFVLKPHTATSEAPASPPISQDITPVEKITAEYAANEVRADASFKGKWVHLSGLVWTVKVLQEPTVELLPLIVGLPPNVQQATVDPVFLTTDEKPSPMTSFSFGDKLDAWCQGDGTLGLPIFRHCRFYINGQPV